MLVLAVLSGPIAFAGLGGDGAALAASDRVAVVSRLAGQVERQGPEGRGVLRAGDPVHAQDHVVTGPDGRARLRFEDGSTVVVGPDSDLEVASYDFGAQEKPGALLRLAEGILRALVDTMPAGSSFAVSSPTAVAAVRGTAFVVQADAGNTGVFVIDGAVFVDGAQPRGEPVLVHSNQGTDVRRGEPPTPPAAWGQERVRKVLDLTRFD